MIAHRRTRRRFGFGRSRRHSTTLDAVEFFTRPEQHLVWQVLGLIVRRRAELTVITVFLVISVVGRDRIGPDATFIVTAVTTIVVFAVPASRRYVTRRAWCVLTRHRMRACFAQTRTMTHNGRMPFLLWSRPSPVGEQVSVWLPAGLSVNRLNDVTMQLATACWAREARVHGSKSQAAFVTIDVVRRDPLTLRSIITPAVIDGIDDHTTDGADVAPLPDRATLPATTPADFPTVQATRQGTNGDGTKPRTTRKTPATTSAGVENDSEPTVTGFGGVDVTDYVD